VLGQFDLIGVVELRDDLTDLGRVLAILGPYWRAVYSDLIPDPGGSGAVPDPGSAVAAHRFHRVGLIQP
jgi:hypothetical protein